MSRESGDALDVVFRLSLAPGEVVIWTGRPRSIRRLVQQSLPKALIGLALMAFTLFWMRMVVEGENNNWDQKQPVGPFAPHNVLIAALAGVWFLPPSLYLLTWPLRTWWSAKRTAYALTDRRALISEPRWFGRSRSRSYSAQALTLMNCQERDDGSGNLVFESRKTWAGWSLPLGFFDIDRVRWVESLVRDLREQAEPALGQLPVPKRDSLGAGAKIYRVPGAVRFLQVAIPLAIGAIVVFCLAGNLILAIVALIFFPTEVLPAIQAHVGVVSALGIAAAILGGLGALAAGTAVAWYGFRFVLAIPIEIALSDEGEVEFRGWLLTTRVRAGEIQSIETGGWTDPNHAQVTIRHEGGTIRFFNQFADFKNLLMAIKVLNPAVEIKGF